MQNSNSEKFINSVDESSPSSWYFSVLGLGIVFYAISCAPGALWQDSGMIQYRVWHNDIEGGMGLALSHPLFYIIAIGAKCIPIGEFAHRVNLVSAVAAAITAANMFLLVRLLTGKKFPAVIAAITLSVSHTFWRHGSIAETYTLYTALLSAELIVLLQYIKTKKVNYLYWLGFFNGLAIANHMLGSIPFLCYFAFVVVLLIQKNIRLSNLGIIICLWVIGALPYEYLIIKSFIQTGDLAGTLSSAVFGASWQGAVLNTSLSPGILRENVLFFFMNFPTPNVILIIIGCFAFFKFPVEKALRNIFIVLACLFLIFAFRYTVPDRYAFFIPFYFMMALFIGLGAHLLRIKMKSRALAFLVLIFSLIPILVYGAAPTLAKKMRLNLGTRNNVAYRDDFEYFLKPWKTGYRGAERFATEALRAVENNSIIYADGTVVYPLLHAQEAKGLRTDVTIVSGHGSINNLKAYNKDTIDTFFKQQAIYVVCPEKSYCPDFLFERYDFVNKGVLFKAVDKKQEM
ncbi:MAG: ArnT family glycosyltransferase [Planctomycetota bacterium]